MKAFKAEIKPVSYKNKIATLATVQLICLMRIKTGGPESIYANKVYRNTKFSKRSNKVCPEQMNQCMHIVLTD